MSHPARVPDVEVRDEGTLVVFTPRSAEGRAWLEANVASEPWQWLGPSLCVEHRCAEPLSNLLIEAGLTVG